MAERFLRVRNSGGNVEYERHLAPYEKVALEEDGDGIDVVCSPLITEQELIEGAIPQAVLDLAPPAEVVEVPVKVAKVRRFSGEGRQAHRFRVVASNGETIAASEGYSRARDRDRVAESIAIAFGAEVEDE